MIDFARVARENLGFSDDVLASVGSPLRVKQTALDGGATPLSQFAVAIAVTVSIMFITLLLAAGTLALEREENAFMRLVRGLVSRTGLLLEKAGLAAFCSLVVCLLMLAGLGLFVDLQWDRFPLWVAAVGAGALAFAAMGLAVGALTREVRAASLLCVMVSLPAHLPGARALRSRCRRPCSTRSAWSPPCSRSSRPSTRSTLRSTTAAGSVCRSCTWARCSWPSERPAGWRCAASPCDRRPHFVVLAPEDVGGQRVDAIQEQQPVQVVDLVQQAAGLEALALDRHRRRPAG